MLLEIEVQVQNTTVKYALETVSFGHFPFSIDNLECYILIGWSGLEGNQ